MEGKVRMRSFDRWLLLVVAFAVTFLIAAPAHAQESTAGPEPG